MGEDVCNECYWGAYGVQPIGASRLFAALLRQTVRDAQTLSKLLPGKRAAFLRARIFAFTGCQNFDMVCVFFDLDPDVIEHQIERICLGEYDPQPVIAEMTAIINNEGRHERNRKYMALKSLEQAS